MPPQPHQLSVTDGIADVRLNCADKANALGPAMFKAIADTGVRLKQDTSVRAVVLSGEGRAFCTGLEIERVTAKKISVPEEKERSRGRLRTSRDIPVGLNAGCHGPMGHQSPRCDLPATATSGNFRYP